MNKTKEVITKEEVKRVLQELLRENIVGLFEAEGNAGFIYKFPGRKQFEISIKEM